MSPLSVRALRSTSLLLTSLRRGAHRDCPRANAGVKIPTSAGEGARAATSGGICDGRDSHQRYVDLANQRATQPVLIIRKRTELQKVLPVPRLQELECMQTAAAACTLRRRMICHPVRTAIREGPHALRASPAGHRRPSSAGHRSESARRCAALLPPSVARCASGL